MYPNSSRRRFLVNLVLMAAMLPWPQSLNSQDRKTDTKDSTKDKDKDKVYEPGGDVKPPKLIHYVEPSFSPKSKEAFVEGTVKISTIVTIDGVATDPHVLSGLNAEEDNNAVEALKQWKFQPGTKSGQPVNVHVTVEVLFHLL